jgi:hypothetical protein
MGNLVLSGATSGSITLEPTAVAGTTTLTLPAVSGTVLTTGSSGQSIPKAALPTGSVLQVVSATYATQTSTSSSTFTDTGLTATITPTSSSSKILVLISHSENQKDAGAASTRIKFNLCRNGSQIIVFGNDSLFTNSSQVNTAGVSFNYLDSPASTSATAYKTQFGSTSGTGAVYVQNGNITSSITLLEIAA